MPQQIQGIPIAPLTGAFDARSTPDLMPKGSLRLRQNWRTVGEGKLRRGDGWSKFLDRDPYGDADFHDQLLTFTPGVGRQPVTMLYEAVSTLRARWLFAATQGKIAKLNEHGANWQILGSGFGGQQTTSAAAPRFRCAQLGDFLVFTNDLDKPVYYLLEAVSVDGSPLLKTFDDLDTIGVSRAGLVVVWRNVVFFADVTMDGARVANRIIWSNYNDPLSFDPAKLESLAGFQDLYTHERILAAKATANSLLWYTTHGIWEMAAVGGAQSFDFARRYNGEDNEGAGVLKYPNTLVGQPDAHFYGAEDGIYVFSPYYLKPDRLEWMHRATPVLGYCEPDEKAVFGRVDDPNCNVHVATASKTQLLFSFAREGAINECPDVTLRVNLIYRTADVIDHGFTAFSNYQSFDAPTIRDFMVEKQICTLQGLQDAGYGFVNENLPTPAPEPTAPFAPTVFWTHETQSFPTRTLEASKTPTTVSRSSNVATITVPTHGFATNDIVTIRGISDPSFNASGVEITVLDVNRFTYTSFGPDVSTTNAAAPFVRRIETARDAVVTVETDGVATVKLAAHGFSSGDHIRVSAKQSGSPQVNSEEVAVTVLDADTFTYPTAALEADTSFGANNITNLLADKLYATATPATDPSTLTSLGITAGQIYKFTPGDNGDKLYLTGPNITLTTESYFTYDGAGATLKGPGIGPWSSSTAYVVGNLASDSGTGGIESVFVCTSNVGPVATRPGADSGHWDVSALTLKVTAKLTGGLAISVARIQAKKVPTLVSRNDQDNPDWATVTLAAHGYPLDGTVQLGGFSDSTFNKRDVTILAVTTDTFTYVAIGGVVTPEAPAFPTVARQVDGTVETEDWNQPTAADDSLCALLGDQLLDSICLKCEGRTLLVAASSKDWCLKAMGEVFYQEECDNPDGTGSTDSDGYTASEGSYLQNVIESILRFAPIFAPEAPRGRPNVQLDRLAISGSVSQDDGSKIKLRVGISGTVCDPNATAEGRIVNFDHSEKALKYLSGGKTEAQHKKANTLPAEDIAWKVLRKGRFLYPELTIKSIGGDCELSGATAAVGLEPAENY